MTGSRSHNLDETEAPAAARGSYVTLQTVEDLGDDRALEAVETNRSGAHQSGARAAFSLEARVLRKISLLS